MHEMALVEGVLQLVEETARREHAQSVKCVVLEIGQLSTVEVDALKFCFDAVTKGSIAEGAALEIVQVPGVGWCVECAVALPMSTLYGACPQCGSYQMQATGGTEMRVKEIEID